MRNGGVIAIGDGSLEGRESQYCQTIVRQEEAKQVDEVLGPVHYRRCRDEQ